MQEATHLPAPARTDRFGALISNLNPTGSFQTCIGSLVDVTAASRGHPNAPMIFPLFRRNARQDTISILYGTIVAQARLPYFYREFGIADTVGGRFDVLVLHLVIILDRLREEAALRDLGQALFDHFCRDMDDNLREMGIGDLSVPKEMRRIGEAFYGRAQAYRSALASKDDAALVTALIRNIYGGSAPAPAAPARLAAYIREAVGDLRAQQPPELLAGRLRIVDPGRYCSG